MSFTGDIDALIAVADREAERHRGLGTPFGDGYRRAALLIAEQQRPLAERLGDAMRLAEAELVAQVQGDGSPDSARAILKSIREGQRP
jgi:hypothetical protein